MHTAQTEERKGDDGRERDKVKGVEGRREERRGKERRGKERERE